MHSDKRVLIIEDEADLCLLLKDYFVRKHYEVMVSHTLKEGEAFIISHTPNILFLDNNLPDGAGWTQAPNIATRFPDMYIVMISAFHLPVPEMPALSKFRIIEKPIALADLDAQFSGL